MTAPAEALERPPCPHPRPRAFVPVSGELVVKRCRLCAADIGQALPRCSAMVTTGSRLRRRCIAPSRDGGRCDSHRP